MRSTFEFTLAGERSAMRAPSLRAMVRYSTGHEHVVGTGRCNGGGDRSGGNVGAFTETRGVGVGVGGRRAELEGPDLADLGEAAELDGEAVRRLAVP